jgi:glucosamine--fructose-6-phosphate aminotransferase (isomerizing)
MCGIFGYIGNKNTAGEIVIQGLKRLDYRGYDSWGVGLSAGGRITVEKEAGKIGDVTTATKMPKGHSALAHTRWATTGAVNKVNAHPHLSTDQSFALVQNGIVENFEELKTALLKKHYAFKSQTDTEVIVRQVEEAQKTKKNFVDAFRAGFLQLHGRNTIAAITTNGDIVAARNGSPLVVGLNTKTKEVFMSSDVLSFAPNADKMIVVDNNQMVTITSKGEIALFDAKNGKPVAYKLEPITIKADKIDKEGYDHFMAKEIHETPYTVRQIVNQNKAKIAELARAIKKAPHVYVIGSGTAGFAAAEIAFYLRIYGGINATSLVGADSRSYYDIFKPGDLMIAPSQSGETADVIEVLEYAKAKGLKIASIVNMPGSMITRMSDYPFMCNCGPEICVMSTKVFSSQISWGYLVAKTVQGKYEDGRKNLAHAAKAIHTYLQDKTKVAQIRKLASVMATKQNIFLLGKYQNLAVINEGMVKLIEGTYRHAHAVPAGDLKHYAITLMEKGVPVIAVVSNDIVKADMMTSINEVRLRGAEVIAVAHENHQNYDHLLPTADTGETDAISNIVPLQLLAYYMAVKLGNNVDKPRNIAKSVTVK